MTKSQMREDYANWLLNLTCGWCHNINDKSYMKLMNALYSKEFTSSILNDKNRASDGIEMRMRFVDEQEGLTYTYHDVYKYLAEPCTLLEMMAALALRCEEYIMGNPELGDRTSVWFFYMLQSMHVDNMSDRNFDIDTVNEAIDRIINRTYAENGDGGLFKVNRPFGDMRYTELWYQMNWYLNELK